MPIPVYNEQAQRYLQPGSSKFMGTKEAEAMIAAEKGGNGNGNGNGKQSSLGSIAAPIVASLRTEFKGLNKHLAFRFEDIKRAIIGTPAEQRDIQIAEEDVKPVTTPPEDETGGSKGSLFDSLKNPFSKDRSPWTRLIAWGAAFFALQLGSEKLAGPDGYLTKFLKWLKETFLPFVTGLWVSIRDYDWKGEWAKVQNIFDSIKKFFADMDVDGDGKISFDELKEGLKNGVKDLADKLVDEIKSGLVGFVGKYGLMIAGVWAGYRITKGLISALLFGGAPKVGPYAGMRFLGLTAILIGGLVTLHNDIKDAYTDVLERDGKVTTKTWIARFLSGDNNPEGKSWTEAILGSWRKGLQGAAVGLTAGLVTGGVFSIPLAAIGFITGSVAGALGLHLGEDKMNAILDDAETNIKQTGEDLKTTANRVIDWAIGIKNAAKAILDPGSTVAGAFNLATKGEGERIAENLTLDIRKKKTSILNLQRMVDQNIKTYGKAHGTQLSHQLIDSINHQKEELKVLEQRRDEAFQTASNVRTISRSEEMISLNKQIASLPSDSPLLADLVARRDALGRTFMGSMDVFKGTLDSPIFTPEFASTTKVKEAEFKAAELAMKNQILVSQYLENIQKGREVMRNIDKEFPVVDASTKVVNQGDIHQGDLKSTPGYGVANILAASWTNYYGYPDAHRR